MSAYSAGYAGNTGLAIKADKNQRDKIRKVVYENGGTLRTIK
jgi:hypothetical protein